jgi:hypothetical protein
METTSQVACFIAARIEATGQLQKDIAAKAGFDKPNMITMIKQGRTRLPLDKVGPMALALETDPIQLLQMCMEEYHPATWAAIAPLLEPKMSEDEKRLLGILRSYRYRYRRSPT